MAEPVSDRPTGGALHRQLASGPGRADRTPRARATQRAGRHREAEQKPPSAARRRPTPPRSPPPPPEWRPARSGCRFRDHGAEPGRWPAHRRLRACPGWNPVVFSASVIAFVLTQRSCENDRGTTSISRIARRVPAGFADKLRTSDDRSVRPLAWNVGGAEGLHRLPTRLWILRAVSFSSRRAAVESKSRRSSRLRHDATCGDISSATFRARVPRTPAPAIQGD